MSKNANLHKAKSAKNDEFYTQLSDIENELKHYKAHFHGKVVYCNCDDSRESNFFKYFFLNFNALGLKKLICTGYKNGSHGVSYVTEVGDVNNNGEVDEGEMNQTELEGDGSYSSPECLELLKEADIVVTNPPFSLFRDYVKTLMDYGKKFLIIGNLNAITYKEIFPLIKENKIWLGIGFNSGNAYFTTPNDTTGYAKGVVQDDGKVKFRNACWFTNLDHGKRHQKLDLVERYDPNEYPKYDNYDAIEVSKTVNIPRDYSGVIGVPITFLIKYCPEQFEIIDINPHFFYTKPTFGRQLSITGQKDPYARILIRNKHPEAPKNKTVDEMMVDFVRGL